MDRLKKHMTDAFCFYFTGKSKEDAGIIRLDGKIWGPEQIEGQVITTTGFKLESSKYHIDPRAKAEYNLFSRYFFESPNLELL
jgi:hypothetical protein